MFCIEDRVSNTRKTVIVIFVTTIAIVTGFIFYMVSSITRQKDGLICDQNYYNFGEISLSQSSIREHTFKLQNKSNKTINIIDISKSCSCTTFNIPNQITVPPHKVANIPILVNFGNIVQSKEVKIGIKTDCKETPFLVLKMLAKIVSPVELYPPTIFFGSLKPGEQRSQIVRLRYTLPSTTKKNITFEKTSEYLSIRPFYNDGDSNSNAETEKNVYPFQIIFTGSENMGTETNNIIFHTSIDEQPTAKLEVSAVHLGIISASPSTVVFASNSKIGTIKKVTVEIKQSGAKPIILLKDINSDNSVFAIAEVKTDYKSDSMQSLTVDLVLTKNNMTLNDCKAILQIAVDTHKLEIPVLHRSHG